MNVLRTPDNRFDALTGYPFGPCYVEVDAGDGRPAADPLHRRRAIGCRGGPAAAWRTVVVLPLPQDDPGTRPPPAYEPSPSTWSASGAATSRPTGVTTPTKPTWTGLGRPSRPSGSTPSPWSARTGRTHRLAPGWRTPRSLHPGRGLQHLPAHRGPPPRRRLWPGSVQPRRSPLPPPGGSSTEAASRNSTLRSSPRTTLLPLTTPIWPAPANSLCSCPPALTILPPRPTEPPGSPCATTSGRSFVPSPTPTPSRGAPTACCAPRSPAPSASHMPRSPEPATSSKRTKAKSWQP